MCIVLVLCIECITTSIGRGFVAAMASVMLPQCVSKTIPTAPPPILEARVPLGASWRACTARLTDNSSSRHCRGYRCHFRDGFFSHDLYAGDRCGLMVYERQFLVSP